MDDSDTSRFGQFRKPTPTIPLGSFSFGKNGLQYDNGPLHGDSNGFGFKDPGDGVPRPGDPDYRLPGNLPPTDPNYKPPQINPPSLPDLHWLPGSAAPNATSGQTSANDNSPAAAAGQAALESPMFSDSNPVLSAISEDFPPLNSLLGSNAA